MTVNIDYFHSIILKEFVYSQQRCLDYLKIRYPLFDIELKSIERSVKRLIDEDSSMNGKG